ncbi:MAG: hypothetical protein Q8P68_05960 [Candidatus Peregrinibacteria bacterium]|nr:hypothetical protein [Candidatus Peregrinibacteria bacterium]MDZ4244946.1 hypothetical protein [Candidatus Gracilibacteria bacterium]
MTNPVVLGGITVEPGENITILGCDPNKELPTISIQIGDEVVKVDGNIELQPGLSAKYESYEFEAMRKKIQKVFSASDLFLKGIEKCPEDAEALMKFFQYLLDTNLPEELTTWRGFRSFTAANRKALNYGQPNSGIVIRRKDDGQSFEYGFFTLSHENVNYRDYTTVDTTTKFQHGIPDELKDLYTRVEKASA